MQCQVGWRGRPARNAGVPASAFPWGEPHGGPEATAADEDVRRRVPDTSLAQRVLGVRAKVSLDEGLRATIAWQIAATRDRPFGVQGP